MKRSIRILIPFWGWGVLSLIVYAANGRSFSCADIFLQFSLGHVVSCPLYFLSLLLLSTVVIKILLMIRCPVGLFIGVLVCLVIQYLELIAPSSSWSMSKSVQIPLGRFFALFPSAVLGLMVAMNKERIASFGCKRVLVICMATFVVIVGLRATRVIPEPNGFGYQGWFATSVACVFLISSVVLGRFRLSNRLENVVNLLGAYSAGIYYTHPLVGYLFPHALLPAFGALRWVVVFVVSFVITTLLVRIPLAKKLVQ